MTRTNTIKPVRAMDRVLFDRMEDTGPDSAIWQTPIGETYARAAKMKGAKGRKFLDRKYGPAGPRIAPQAPPPDETLPWQMEFPRAPVGPSRRARELADLLDRQGS